MRPSRENLTRVAVAAGAGAAGAWAAERRGGSLRLAQDLRTGRRREGEQQRWQIAGPAQPDEAKDAHETPYSLYTNVGSRAQPR